MRLLLGGRIGEIGYSISRSHWRRGFATEAARAVVNAAFHSCPVLLKLRAIADVRNQSSIRVLEKIPMQREGVLRLNQLTRDQLLMRSGSSPCDRNGSQIEPFRCFDGSKQRGQDQFAHTSSRKVQQ